MRILHVLHSFPPYSRGGTESYVEQIACAQSARGDAVAVLHAVDSAARVREAARLAASKSQVGAGVHADSPASVRASTRGALRVIELEHAPLLGGRALLDPEVGGQRESLRELFARERADIVHVHHWHGLDLRLVSLARAAGSAVVVTLHDYFTSCARFFRVQQGELACPPDQPRAACAACLETDAPGQRELIEGLLVARERMFREELASAGACIAVSESQRRMLAAIPALAGLEFETARFPWAEVQRAATTPALTTPTLTTRAETATRTETATRAEAAPHMATHPVASPATPASAARTQRVLSIATWGGLVRGKGLHVLVDACARLADPSRVEVHHYGGVLDRAYADACRAAARGFELHLHGPFAAHAAERLFGAHDLAVFPSLFHETHGYAIDEALLLGLPVLVSARGASAERIGTRGLAFAAGDALALRDRIAELVDAPARLAELRAGRHAAPISLAEHMRALDSVYARVARARG